MKKALVLCAIVGAAVYAATAMSASGPTPIEKTLQKQVATLNKTVATLKKNQAADEAAIGVTLLFTICSDEIAADALQGTWSVVDQIATAAGQAARFGPQTPVVANVSGQDVCATGGITRTPVTSGAIPTIGGYQALLGGLSAYKLQTLLRHAALHH
ncbi:MAG TPA: hypothetical protein VHS03_13755 [Gaiellaceae bacterium]|jgi:hypothetical protein|nr:hypothetical protein [Gaiellaceae bacterium]